MALRAPYGIPILVAGAVLSRLGRWQELAGALALKPEGSLTGLHARRVPQDTGWITEDALWCADTGGNGGLHIGKLSSGWITEEVAP